MILTDWLPVIFAIFVLFKNISPIDIEMILTVFYDNYFSKYFNNCSHVSEVEIIFKL